MADQAVGEHRQRPDDQHDQRHHAEQHRRLLLRAPPARSVASISDTSLPMNTGITRVDQRHRQAGGEHQRVPALGLAHEVPVEREQAGRRRAGRARRWDGCAVRRREQGATSWASAIVAAASAYKRSRRQAAQSVPRRRLGLERVRLRAHTPTTARVRPASRGAWRASGRHRPVRRCVSKTISLAHERGGNRRAVPGPAQGAEPRAKNAISRHDADGPRPQRRRAGERARLAAPKPVCRKRYPRARAARCERRWRAGRWRRSGRRAHHRARRAASIATATPRARVERRSRDALPAMCVAMARSRSRIRRRAPTATAVACAWRYIVGHDRQRCRDHAEIATGARAPTRS